MLPPRIESYKYGVIVIEGRSYDQDVIICPDKVHLARWLRKRKPVLTRRDVETLLREKPRILVIGLGAGAQLGLTRKAIKLLESAKIKWHTLPTKKACRLYNRLKDEERVVAALHLTS